MREEEEGRGKEGETLGERQWRKAIRRVIPEWEAIYFILSPLMLIQYI